MNQASSPSAGHAAQAPAMATALIGSIEPFDASANDWETYAARLEQFLDANSIKEDKKVATLLTLIGGPTFQLLRNLVAPNDPKTKSFNELATALKQHFSPAPLAIAERYRFHKRDQAPGETVVTYVAELRRMARHCDFGTNLDTTLRDRLVCGLKSEATIKKLLQEKSLDLEKAVAIATATEIASRDAAELGRGAATGSTAQAVHRFGTRPPPPKPTAAPSTDTCFRCGRSGHLAQNCKCKDMECRRCGKRGHIARACLQTSSKPSSTHKRRQPPQQRPSKTHALEEEDTALYSTSATPASAKAMIVQPTINGTPMKMELDTGSALTIIPDRLYQRHLSEQPLAPTSVILRTYSGERIKPLGAIHVEVEYNGQHHEGKAVVVKTDGPALFGRDWLQHIRIDWSHVHRLASNTASTQRRLDELLKHHSAVFGEDRGRFRHCKGRLHLVDGAKPRFFKARPLPYALREKVATELDRLENDGILTKVDWSEWATPVVSVAKKDGSVRLCGDFKVSLNSQLKIDQYPLPRVDDVFASLAGGSQRFTKIDLRQAYLQLEMEDESKKYLVLNTHKGLYRLNRLAFGIASAPAIWQRAMDQLLQGIPDTHCILDDILITGIDDEHHLANVKAVLQRLEDAGLRANRQKCSFLQPKIDYCGHEVSEDGLHKMPAKVDAIQQAPVPENVSQLRSFLGLVNYYARFLPNLSTTLHPLNALLQKGTAWRWTAACHQAFDKVKGQIASDLVLTHFNPALPLRLASDASPYGIGAVMSHVLPNGTERPIAFASRTLSTAERNYAQIDKEALAIVWAVRKFHTYLYGRDFVLVTDHTPLTAIFHPEKDLPAMTAARLQRYALFLAGHRYSIEYRNTHEHANADGLSRLPLASDAASHPVDVEVDAFHVAQLEHLPVTATQIRTATRQDPTWSSVYNAVQYGNVESIADMQPFASRFDQLATHQGCLLWGSRVAIPPSLQARILQELHLSHPGIVRMKELARSYVWWPRIDQDIEKTVRECNGCQLQQKQPSSAPLHPWEWPARPWQRVHVDFAGPFLGSMFLLLVDARSKWPEVVPMQSTTATKTVECLRTIFARHGLPEQLVSDNGPQFVSEQFQDFLQGNGIQHIRSAPYHPSTNGLVERFVHTFKHAMRASETSLSLNERLQRFLRHSSNILPTSKI